MKKIIFGFIISFFTIGTLQAMQEATEFIITKVAKEKISKKRKLVKRSKRTVSCNIKDASKRLKSDERLKVPCVQETPEKIDIENDIDREAEAQLVSFSSEDNKKFCYQIGAILNASQSSLEIEPNFLANFFRELKEMNEQI